MVNKKGAPEKTSARVSGAKQSSRQVAGKSRGRKSNEPLKVIVYSPWHFSLQSGGMIALHKLTDNLSKIQGVEAYIYTSVKHPGYGGTLINGDEYLSIMDDKTIVVYPEVVNRNPLNAKNVVRYILYTPGIFPNGDGGELCDENTYGKNDRYFLYDEIFKVAHPERIAGKIPIIDPFLDIFKVANTGPRTGTCYIVRKCGYKKQDWHDKNSILVDKLIVSAKFEELAKIFNECHTLICYDEACFTTTQAALCGCLSVIVPKEGLSAEEWYEGLPTHKYGQSYGLTGLVHALETQPLLLPFVRKQEQQAFKHTKAFVDYCRNWMKL